MPDKSQQFMTDEFVAARSAEANHYKVAAGQAIGQGLQSGVNEWQQSRQLADQHDAWIANVALRQKDQEMSAHAQAFDEMIKQKEMARRQQELEGELALKNVMRQEYQFKMQETANMAYQNWQVRKMQEDTVREHYKTEQMRQMVAAAELKQKEDLSAQENSHKMFAHINTLFRTLQEHVDTAGSAATQEDKDALASTRDVLMAYLPKAAASPTANAKKLLGVTGLPKDVSAPNQRADYAAAVKIIGNEEVLQKWASSGSFPRLVESLASIMPKLRAKAAGDEQHLRAFLSQFAAEHDDPDDFIQSLTRFAYSQ